MKKDTSGSAFARNVDIKEAYELNVDQMEKIIGDTSGLSKREYFAAKAMTRVISEENIKSFCGEDDYFEIIAAECYKYADAMLSEGEK